MNERQIEAIFKPKKSYLKGMKISIILLPVLVVALFVMAMVMPVDGLVEFFLILGLFDLMAIILFGTFYLGSKAKVRKAMERSDIEIIKNELRKDTTQSVLNGKMYLTDRYVIAFPSGQLLILPSYEIESLYTTRVKQSGIVAARFLNARTKDGGVYLLLNDRNQNNLVAVMQIMQARYGDIQIR